MDMISFGAALIRVLRRKQEEIVERAFIMRIAFNASAKDWKKWNKSMEAVIKPKKKGPGEFAAAVASGAISGSRA